MKQAYQIRDLTSADGKGVEIEWLVRAEPIHRQLRPLLSSSYPEQMKRIFTNGARMSIVTEDDQVVAIAVYRIYENTSNGVMMYVDDLVTDEAKRSRGAGKLLFDHLHLLARKQNCEHIKLDSGTQRQQAHKFYFREGMLIAAFHFIKRLGRD